MLKNFTYKYFILFYVIYEGKERLAKLLVVLANFGFPPIFFFFFYFTQCSRSYIFREYLSENDLSACLSEAQVG